MPRGGHENASENKTVYTVEDIAKILSVSKASAYKLLKEGHFSVMRVGSAIRIPKSSFERCSTNNHFRKEEMTEMTSIVNRGKNYAVA